jgi:hypothetical protein
VAARLGDVHDHPGDPVKDGLVDTLKHYPGFSTFRELAQGDARQYFYYNRTAWWKQGGPAGRRGLESFVEWVELKVTPLPSHEAKTAPQRQTWFRKQVAEREEVFREERKAEGLRVAGVKRLRELNHKDRPETDDKRDVSPLSHGSKEARKEYKRHYEEIRAQRAIASVAFREGHTDVEFPRGTFRPPIKTAYFAARL